MNTKKRMIVLILTVAVAGCATGFDRAAAKRQLGDQQREIADWDVKRAFEHKGSLKFPISLGVFFTDGRTGSDWTWEVQDKKAVLSALEPLKAARVVSNVFVVSDLLVKGKDPAGLPLYKDIRQAASAQGADAVLVVRGAVQVDRYINPLAFFNITIVGGFIVPGSHRAALFVVKAAMWDLEHEQLYLAVEAEGVGKTVAPTFIIRDKWAIDQAKERALTDFQGELIERLRSLKGS
jgi:hypothetical protein